MAKIKAANRLQRLEKEQQAGLVAERTSELQKELEERRRTEEALRESEAHFRSYYELAMSLFDRHGDHITGKGMVQVNDRLCAMLGYSREELGRMTWSALTHLDDLGADVAQFQRMLAGEIDRYSMDKRFIRKDGEVMDASLSVQCLRAKDGSVHNIVAMVQDITERKRAEEALRDERWRLENIIEGTHVGTWEWNFQTGETVYNEVWAQIVGYTLDELAPTTIKTWRTLAHPDDIKQSAELLERHFAGELPYYENECRMKHKDGHWVWVHDRAVS